MGSALLLAFEAASLIEKETAALRSLKQEYRMSNHAKVVIYRQECRISKEGILSNFMDSKGRAQRFHPSLFCGSKFCCSAVRCLARWSLIREVQGSRFSTAACRRS